MAPRNLVDDAAPLDFCGNLPAGPLADGPLRGAGGLTCQCDNLALLLGGDPPRCPGRGASVKRSAMGKSSRVAGCNTRHRSRQRRTNPGSPNWRAIWQLFAPAAAANTIRARRASCCGVPWRRTRDSSPWRSVSESVMARGLGPRIRSSSVKPLAWVRADVTLFCSAFIFAQRLA